MNLCPCGYHGDEQADCHCSADKVANYRRKVSGPLLDRIDLHVTMPRPTTEVLRTSSDAESSATVRERVVAAWRRQHARQGCVNAALQGNALDSVCDVAEPGWRVLESAARQFNLSVRAHHRVLRVARTIADLAAADTVAPECVAEALSLRCLDRQS